MSLVMSGGCDNGTDATGVTPPLGGVGIRGWLSGIFSKLSGTLTVAFSSAQHVIVDTAPTTTVTGSISLTANTPDVTDRAGRLLGHVTVDAAPGTNLTQIIGAAPSATNPLPVRIANGAGFTDARTPIALSVSGVASVTTVALLTLNIYKAGVVTSANNYTVTAGKTFRITAIQFGVRFAVPSTTVTFGSTTFVLRFVTSGTVAVTSGILHQDSKMAASNAPTPNSDLAIPDGFDLPAGYNFGVTHLASATTLLEDVLILGYEF